MTELHFLLFNADVHIAVSGTTLEGGEMNSGLPEPDTVSSDNPARTRRSRRRQVRAPVPVQHRRGPAVPELFVATRASADTAPSWGGSVEALRK